MKRKQLERHLRKHGAVFDHHGSKHDVWRGAGGQETTVPRHREIKTPTARDICDQLGVPRPAGR